MDPIYATIRYHTFLPSSPHCLLHCDSFSPAIGNYFHSCDWREHELYDHQVHLKLPFRALTRGHRHSAPKLGAWHNQHKHCWSMLISFKPHGRAKHTRQETPYSAPLQYIANKGAPALQRCSSKSLCTHAMQSAMSPPCRQCSLWWEKRSRTTLLSGCIGEQVNFSLFVAPNTVCLAMKLLCQDSV